MDNRTAMEREQQRRDFWKQYSAVRRELQPQMGTHLTVVAFLAAMARVRGLVITSADSLYVAGYYAKREQQRRELYPYEREQLRRAADRVWSALQHLNASPAHARVVTQGEMGNG